MTNVDATNQTLNKSVANLNESQNQTKSSPTVKETQLSAKEQQLQAQKERTLFCINIDQRCTEDIIFELFLQAGPIENLVRKPDRNGNLIALITYKHLESCDYAIKLFNGISLFNQPLKVQFSQNSLTSRGSMSNLNTPNTRENVINNYSNLNNKSNSDSNNLQTPNSNNRNRMRQQIDMNNSQSMPSLGEQNGIINLMLQQFSQNMLQTQLFTSPQVPQPLMMGNQAFNRSKSGSNLQEFNDVPNDSHQSRRANHYDRQNYNRAQSYHQHHHSRSNHNQDDSQRHDSYNRPQQQHHHHHNHHQQQRHHNSHHMDQSHSRERNRSRRSRSRSRL